MSIPTTTVESWEHLSTLVFENSFSTRLARYRSPYAFRGMCGDWPLKPSLHRMGHAGPTLAMIEHVMLRNFQKYAHREAGGVRSEWEWLSIAQHHGLPTRLLDWTYSPMVALHFATNELDKMNQDGALWMIDFVQVRDLMPRVLQQVLNDSAAYSFSVQMLEKQFPEIEDVERLKGGAPDFVVFFEPPSLDARIVNQFGLFSFMNRPDALLDDWLAGRGRGLARKLVIPAGLKWELRDKLDGQNVTERVMMPGLDGLSAWLKRWYSAKAAVPGARKAETPDLQPPRTPPSARRKPSARKPAPARRAGRRSRAAGR